MSFDHKGVTCVAGTLFGAKSVLRFHWCMDTVRRLLLPSRRGEAGSTATWSAEGAVQRTAGGGGASLSTASP